MDNKKDQNAPKEMEKRGVVCHCANGDRPKDLEKTGEAGMLRCPYCGVPWLDTGTDEKCAYTKP